MTGRAGWRGATWAALACVASGCTAIVDGDRFRGHFDAGGTLDGSLDGAGGDGSMLGDGAVIDGAPDDGALVDAAEVDATMLDAAVPDATVADGSVLDAAPVDGQTIDAQPADAAIIGLTSIEPTQIVEGVGSSPSSAGTPVVFHGINLMGAVLSCTDASVHCGALTVSADGTLAAAVLTSTPDGTLADGATRAVTLTLTAGGKTASKDISLLGLDSLTVPAGDFNVTASSLKARYSTITLSAAASFRGVPIARLVATSSISVTAAINVDGRGDGSAGAGGCAGGATGGSGGCAPGGGAGGGASGTTGQGGGGGGNATNGTGGSGGSAGGMVGDPMITPMSSTGMDSRGNGGGGGGSGTLGNGGNGGGGGGTLELTSLGSLTLNAPVTSDGGNGQAGGVVLCATAGGGGGGGSGGVILVRAAASISVGGTGALQARAGGTTSNGCSNPGGGGAAGRIRVDAPLATVTGLGGTPTAARGPMWATATPQLVTASSLSVTLFGGSNQSYGWFLNGGTVNTATTGINGMTSPAISVTGLSPGLNTLCALVKTSADASKPEATNCRTIAYVP